MSGLAEIANVLCHEAEVVVVRRDASRVPDAFTEREGSRVTLASLREVAAIRADVRERSDGVRFDAHVADGMGRSARALEVDVCAVEFALSPEARADVAEHRADSGGVVDRGCA